MGNQQHMKEQPRMPRGACRDSKGPTPGRKCTGSGIQYRLAQGKQRKGSQIDLGQHHNKE